MIITSSHFLQLIKSKKKLSEENFPLLIHRLIRETVSDGSYSRVPVGDDIFVPGWDAVIRDNLCEHRFIPKGNIVFEFGCKTDKKTAMRKIDEDYKKRKDDSELTNKDSYSYIGITTAILDSKTKENLNNQYGKENIFKSVLILDAIDVVDWMEEHIDICIWFLNLYGEKINDYGITLLNQEWEKLSACTNPNLKPSLFKVSNESTAMKIIRDFQEDEKNRILTISSQFYGSNYAFAFCVASLWDSDSTSLKNKTIIVNDQSSLNYVNAFCKGKLVLVNFNCSDERFAIHLNNTYILFDSLFGTGLYLEMIRQKDFEKEVEKIGFSKSEAYKISFLADYNPLALRRLLTKIPVIKIPAWSKSNKKNDLIPLLLLGELNMNDDICVSFLKAVIGDDIDSYAEKLNIWSEMNESPILKYDNTFKICARRECFEFLQVDVFSQKLHKLETRLVDELSKNNSNYRIRNNRRYIENIINGFIILSEKNRNNQLHFDYLVESILKKLFGNYELTLSMTQLFGLFAELSPASLLTYFKTAIKDDKDLFVKSINASNFDCLGNQCDWYILFAIERTLRYSDYSVQGLELLLDIFYLNGSDSAFNEVIKILTPVATMAGLIAIPLHQKITFFFDYVKGKDENKTKKIMEKIYGEINNSIAIGVHQSYRSEPVKEINVTYEEIFDVKSKAFAWLIEHGKEPNETINTFKDLLKNIYVIPKKRIEPQLQTFMDKAKDFNDELKALICREVLKTRRDIIIRDKPQLSSEYLSIFEQFLKVLEPKDEYFKVKYKLIDNQYPLYNPPSRNDSDWYEKEIELREQEREASLKALVQKQGQPVISRLIQDIGEKPSDLWYYLYKYSEDHFGDLNQMRELNLSTGIQQYLFCFSDSEIDTVLKLYEENVLIVRNLPYTKKIYMWISGKALEKEYWKSKYYDYRNHEDSEYLIYKFIKFSPEKLIGPCAYLVDLDYHHALNLLDSIIASYYDDNEQQSIKDEYDALSAFIQKLDSKYYTPELSLREFKLLPLLKGGMSDYPLGLKKYFWDNPGEFGNILVEFYMKHNTLQPNSLGSKIYWETETGMGGGCFIPIDYLPVKKSEINTWCDKVLQASKGQDSQTKELLKKALLSIFVSYPKQKDEGVWPIEEIADEVELIASEDFDDKYKVSSMFCSMYINKRGVRTVLDGTPELLLSREFAKYKEFYKFTHPVTSKALEYIEENYKFEAESDRKESVLGYN